MKLTSQIIRIFFLQNVKGASENLHSQGRKHTRYLLVTTTGGEAEAAGLDVNGEDLQPLMANPGWLLGNHLLLAGADPV